MKRLIAISMLSLIVLACTKDFEKINKNPNAPEEIEPEFLLANVISVAGNQNTYEQGFILANYLAQFSASIEFERIDRYEMGTNAEYWDNLYGLLVDIQSMKETEGSNEAYAAVGDIMRCHIFSQLTDMWGDVPYTQAVMTQQGNFKPVYDRQEDIYTDPETGLLTVLEETVQTLQNTNASIEGDVMYNGDLSKWVRFANSLRVRYLLRISKQVDVKNQLQTLVSSGMLMQSNADNAVLPYLSSAPNCFPFSQASVGANQEHRMTQEIDSTFEAWSDPRVEVFYKPTKASPDNAPVYNGLLNGQSRETIASKGIDLQKISLFGSVFRDVPNGVDMQFMQYAELQFALAEAAERGFISRSAQNYYEEGIRASFDYWDTELPSNYLMKPSIVLNGTNNLEKILTQKWVSLFNNGHEAWFNVRRTGIPSLEPGPDNLNGGRYPVRYLYPESEQATNSVNFQEAANRMGGNTINSKGWWESGNRY